jgi:hypothetical protein
MCSVLCCPWPQQSTLCIFRTEAWSFLITIQEIFCQPLLKSLMLHGFLTFNVNGQQRSTSDTHQALGVHEEACLPSFLHICQRKRHNKLFHIMAAMGTLLRAPTDDFTTKTFIWFAFFVMPLFPAIAHGASCLHKVKVNGCQQLKHQVCTSTHSGYNVCCS